MEIRIRTDIIFGLILCLVFLSGCRKKIPIKEKVYCLDWADMPYHNQTEDDIINQLGKPDKTTLLKIYKSNNWFSIYRPLIRFLPTYTDTVLIKELYWKQDSYFLYYWLINKNSVWTSVDGIMYDPDHVQF